MLKTFSSTIKKKSIIIIVVSFLIFMLFFPYIKAEYYTTKYGSQFKDLYSLTGMIDGVEFCKVVEYSNDSAKVYYVEKDIHATHYLYFSRDIKSNEWILISWETIWSKYGSADDLPWPFYFKENRGRLCQGTVRNH